MNEMKENGKNKNKKEMEGIIENGENKAETDGDDKETEKQKDKNKEIPDTQDCARMMY